MDATTTAWVYGLVSPETRHSIGARDHTHFTETADRVQWRISRPPFVHDTGGCFLAITRSEAGCSISIGRKGMCADIYTEASASGVPDELVDETVRRLWRTGR
jgi:hypothetical protein